MIPHRDPPTDNKINWLALRCWTFRWTFLVSGQITDLLEWDKLRDKQLINKLNNCLEYCESGDQRNI